MGLRKSEIGWAFKDEHVLVDEKDVVPLEVNNWDVESTFQPKIDFERFIVMQMKIHSTRLNKIEKSLTKVQKKLNDCFDNDDIIKSDSEDEDMDEDDKADEAFIDISD